MTHLKLRKGFSSQNQQGGGSNYDNSEYKLTDKEREKINIQRRNMSYRDRNLYDRRAEPTSLNRIFNNLDNLYWLLRIAEMWAKINFFPF